MLNPTSRLVATQLGVAILCSLAATGAYAQSLNAPATLQADLDGKFRYSIGLVNAPIDDATFGVGMNSDNTTIPTQFADYFCQFGLIGSFLMPPDGGYGRLIDPTQEGEVRFDYTLCLSGTISTTTRVLPDPRSVRMRTGDRPTSIAVADLDGDGFLDAVTANEASNDVSVLLGDGSGLFRATASYPAGTLPQSVAVADFNRDSLPDLATANGRSDDVSVLIQSGSGGFWPTSAFDAGSSPHGLAVADFNRDGAPDIATANAASNDVSVLLNTGSGEFAPARNWPANFNPVAIAAADLDGDAIVDLVVANRAPATVSVLLGNGDGSFGPTRAYSVASRPEEVAVADLDGDGTVDIVTTNRAGAGVRVVLGAGDGTFGAPASYSSYAYEPVDVALADLNGDEILDFATANFGSDNVTVRLGDGNGTFLSLGTQYFDVGIDPRAIAVADMDGNSIPDILTTNWSQNSVSVILNPFDGTIPGTISATIDIKPESDENKVNRSGRGLLPVALLASEEIDVTDVDPATLVFGAGQATPAHDLSNPGIFADHLREVDGDGRVDLVTHYSIEASLVPTSDSAACLRGELSDGRRFEGCDTIQTFYARGARRSNK
jgi:hypothetical protein